MVAADPRYPNVMILSLQEDADIKRLHLLFSGMRSLPSEADLLAEQPRLELPSRAIASLIMPDSPCSIRAKSVLVESEYIDRDANIAYAILQARAFRDYPRRTVRLHFFSEKLTSFGALLNEEELQKTYLGFCVLSPSDTKLIGRTVLPPPHSIDNSWFFVPTQSEFSVNVGGAQLRAKGTAFIEQDHRLAACASAATWMSTIILARKFAFDMLTRSAAEITQLATKYSLPTAGHGFSPGLTVQQILWALHEMGYEPLTYDIHDPHESTELIYNCVESGIPPILIVCLPAQKGYHAVTVCGHTYEPTLDPTTQISQGVCSTNIWCPRFLFHDDQIAPYLKLAIGPPNPRSNGKPSLLIDESDPMVSQYSEDIREWYQDAYLLSVIMPFPPRHVMGPDRAAIKGKAILMQAYALYRTTFELKMPTPPIYRTYFISSSEYRRRFVPESDSMAQRVPGLSPELAHWYRGAIYPRYIWVTELCGSEHRVGFSPVELASIADVTIDPTSSPNSLDFVTLHLPHLFFQMPPTENNVHRSLSTPKAYIQEDKPYQPLVRMGMASPPEESS